MITLCCSHKIRQRLSLSARPPAPCEPSTRLGNWYVHLVQFGRLQLVLGTSERSLLTVVLPARGLRETIVENLQVSVGQVLWALGIPANTVNRELEAMTPVTIAAATNRRVIGSMNELAIHLGVDLNDIRDPLALSLRLCDTPMSAVGSKSRYGIPREVACELLMSRGN
jgi:plasmid maintenance system antidote protein VapI